MTTPVVVLNCRRQGGIGIVRSLGRLGIPVWAVNHSRATPFFSRYTAGGLIWDFDNRSPAETIEFLMQLAARIGRKPILVATTDDSAIFLADHAPVLQSRYLYHAPSPAIVHGLSSKREMFELATRYGIPTPHCVFPASRADIESYADSGEFPVMLKGIDGKRLQQIAGKRMFIVRDPHALLDAYDQFEDPSAPNIMLQEYIPGGDDTVWMFNGYFDGNSRCLFGMTGKKIHQFPIHTGLTSLGVCLHNQAVYDLTQRFMGAIAYRGILDIGFRYDHRDGKYKVLDVNPRIGATFRLFATRSGFDVARALYFDLTGQPVEPATQRDGRKWVVEDIELVSMARYLFGREAGIGDLLRSLSGVEERAFFASDDPLPFLMMFAGILGKLAPRIRRRDSLQSTERAQLPSPVSDVPGN